MPLSSDRVRFSHLLCALELYAQNKGYSLARDEGRVLYERKGKAKMDGITGEFTDMVHMANSFHYSGLAQDFVLYSPDGTPQEVLTPVWDELSKYWLSLDSMCTWGGDFLNTKTGAHSDICHFSYGEGK